MREMLPGEALAKMLAKRDLSVTEARGKLVAAGVPSAEADVAVERAAGSGYLDDARLAARLVERELARRPPPSAELIAHRLEARGIARATAAAAVRAGADREAVRVRLREYVRRERGRTPARRIYGRLVRLGHAAEVVAALLEPAEEDSGPVDDGDV